MSVDVLLVSYNTRNLLGDVFSTLAASDYSGTIRTLVVDNASSDDSVDILEESKLDLLITNELNVGFGRANNQLLPHVKSDYVLLLNTDAFVEPGTLSSTIAFMDANPHCGILGVKLVGRDGELQPSCRYFPTPWNLFLARTGLARFFKNYVMVDDMIWAHDEVRECDWVPGCYYLVRRAVIDQVGLFDPRFFMYYEEVDHCRRTKAAGWKVCFFPGSSVVHLGGESAKTTGKLTNTGKQLSDIQVESEILYFRKHYGFSGVFIHWVLFVLGASVVALKQGARRGQGKHAISYFLKKITQFRKVLVKTKFGRFPTR